ncbi:MAG: V-type ATP synthase subunit D [Thermoanaerobaculia bacterium]
MIASTSRSRLYELRRDRVAALRGADLLERKREVLHRETARRAASVARLKEEAQRSYSKARALLRIAEVELGAEGVAAAGLAQPMNCSIESRPVTVMGVRFADVHAVASTYRAVYGAAATSASLDDAGAAFSALLPLMIELAAEESALARLRVAVRKVTKIVNALQKVILPRLERQIRLTVDSIAEEERDEAVRLKMRMAAM